MSFHSYFVRLERSTPQFCSTVFIEQKSAVADFKRLSGNVFIVYFKAQVDLRHLQTIDFKKKESHAVILFPVLAKYNQRKLKKWSELLSTDLPASFPDLLVQVAAIDKFIEVVRLLSFFSLDRHQVIPLLLQLEVRKQIKLIDVHHLLVTPYSHAEEIVTRFTELLQQAYEKREQSLKLADVERKIKVPQSSLFFRYIMHSLQDKFEFKVTADRLLMQKLPLTDKDRKRIAEVVGLLKKERLDVFSLDQLLKIVDSGFADIHDTLWQMLDEDRLTQLDERNFVFTEDLQRILNRMKKYKRNQGDMISIDAFRDLTGLSRKYIIVLFEYFDRLQFTQRVGNQRKIMLNV